MTEGVSLELGGIEFWGSKLTAMGFDSVRIANDESFSVKDMIWKGENGEFEA